jgi:hypothetical protein
MVNVWPWCGGVTTSVAAAGQGLARIGRIEELADAEIGRPARPQAYHGAGGGVVAWHGRDNPARGIQQPHHWEAGHGAGLGRAVLEGIGGPLATHPAVGDSGGQLQLAGPAGDRSGRRPAGCSTATHWGWRSTASSAAGRSGARSSSWAAGSWSCRAAPSRRQPRAWRCGCRCVSWPGCGGSSPRVACRSCGSPGGSRGAAGDVDRGPGWGADLHRGGAEEHPLRGRD